MAVPTVDILFVIGEVPSLEDAAVLAEVAEGLVGVDAWETAVEHGDADALAVDAAVTEEFATHAHELCLQGAVDGGVIQQARLVVRGGGKQHVALDGLHTEHVGQSLDAGGLLGGGHDADCIEPTAAAEFLGGEGGDTLLVGSADGVVAHVVEVGAAGAITLYGLGIKIRIRVERGTCLVGKEDPVDLLRLGTYGSQDKGEDKGYFFHGDYFNTVCNIS